MSRSNRKGAAAKSEGGRAPEAPFGERLDQLERLRHVEALLEAGMRHVMAIGWGNSDNGGGRILRPDGSQVAPIDTAVELAVDRLRPALDAIALEVESIEGTAPGAKRMRYKVELAEALSAGAVSSREAGPAEALGRLLATLVDDAVGNEFRRRAQRNAKTDT